MAGGWSKQMGVEWHLKVESKGLEIESLIWSTGVGGDGICQGEKLRKAGKVRKELTAVSSHSRVV